MSRLRDFLNHPYTFWALLCLPAIPALNLLLSDNPKAIHIAVHPTGEFAARFMIIALMITPLTLLLPSWRGPRWLMKRRRYLGVAAFLYALAHLTLYLIDKGAVAWTQAELMKLHIWTGWVALLIFAPLAITSTDGWVRSLGPKWKQMQRWVYAAAALTLIHWACLHEWKGAGPALVHFAPLALLTGYRSYWNLSRRRARAAA